MHSGRNFGPIARVRGLHTRSNSDATGLRIGGLSGSEIAQLRAAAPPIDFHTFLQSEDGYQYFSQFLVKEHSSENVVFWKMVETYRLSFNKEDAFEIFETYIRHGARNELNISSEQRKQVEASIVLLANDQLPGNMKTKLFDGVQDEILGLMQRGSFARFKLSEFYDAYLAATIQLPAPKEDPHMNGIYLFDKEKVDDSRSFRHKKKTSGGCWGINS